MAKSVDDGGVWFALQNSGGAGRDPGRDEQADHFTLRNARGERANCTAIAVVLVKFLDLDHVNPEDAVGGPSGRTGGPAVTTLCRRLGPRSVASYSPTRQSADRTRIAAPQ